MEQEELDKHLIPASLAASAMVVSSRSIHLWFAAGDLEGEQTLTGRLWVTAGSCRALIRRRRGQNSQAEAYFDQFLRREELPKSPFSLSEVTPQGRVLMCS